MNFIYRFNGEIAIDNDSANSREALIDKGKSSFNRRFSNGSQSSHDLSDGDRRKEIHEDTVNRVDDLVNSGSIVGLDWLFENDECTAESWANKSK